MVKIEEPSNYVNAEIVGKGIEAVINDEGAYHECDTKWGKKDIFSMNVLVNNDTMLIYSPNRISRDRMVEAWGDDSAGWVGKKIKLNKVGMIIAGKMQDAIVATPIDEGVKTPAKPKSVKPAPKSEPAPANVKDSSITKAGNVDKIVATARVKMAINKHKGHISFEEIAEQTQLPDEQITEILGSMIRLNEIYQPRGGMYANMG